MENLEDNNLIRFKNISKKKENLFANFKVKGLKCGVSFSSTLSVDLSSLELHPGDTLEKIIEECAKKAVKEFKKADLQFDGVGPSVLPKIDV